MMKKIKMLVEELKKLCVEEGIDLVDVLSMSDDETEESPEVEVEEEEEEEEMDPKKKMIMEVAKKKMS